MVSVTLDKSSYRIGEVATATIRGLPWFSWVGVSVINLNQNKVVYYTFWFNGMSSEATHTFNTTSEMIGENKFKVVVSLSLSWIPIDSAETDFSVYTSSGGGGGGGGGDSGGDRGGGGGGFESIWSMILQYTPYILIFMFVLVLLLVLKKKSK